MDYRVLSYGAKGDGKTIDTKAFQQAIDDCSKTGGRVLVEKNHTYILGSIELKSNVTLYLEKDSVIKMSSNLDDFINLGVVKDLNIYRPTYENCDYDGKPTKFFIYSKNAENISIEGEGTIDGNEEIFYGTITKWHIEGSFYPRIPLLCIEGVKGLIIKDVTLTHSGFWTCHLVGTENILIDGIKILNNLRMVNCDGIDPDHCKNVVIRNCHIESADDCIVLKCTEGYKEYGATENILVENCDLMSTSAAIKFGSESVCDFKNVIFKNINIHDSNRGISLQLRDEGNISDIRFENINITTRLFSPLYWWGKGEAIALTAVKRASDKTVGTISNVSFKNITSVGENGIFIYGTDKNISDVKFENIDITIKGKTKWEKTSHDIRPCQDNGIFNDKLTGLYVNSSKDISLNKLNISFDSNLSDVDTIDKNIIDSTNVSFTDYQSKTNKAS